MLEKEDSPIKIENDLPLCEVCGSILLTAQERVLRKCTNHSQ